MDRSIPRYLQARTAALGDALPNSCLAALWDALVAWRLYGTPWRAAARRLFGTPRRLEKVQQSAFHFFCWVSQSSTLGEKQGGVKKSCFTSTSKKLVRTGLLCAQEFNDNISLHGMTMFEPRSVSTSPSLGDSLAFQIPVGSLRKKPHPIPWLRTRTDE